MDKSAFSHAAPQTVPYAIERFQVETQRLYGVLNHRLGTSPWLGGEHYSIADIAAWPWVNNHVRQRIDLANYPAVHNWYERIRQRPATIAAMQKYSLINPLLARRALLYDCGTNTTEEACNVSTRRHYSY